MKVLQINATYGYTSTGLIVQDIGKMLQDSGHEAFFAYQKALKHPKNGYVVGNILDWKLHALLCRVFGRQGYYSRHATKKLLKYIEKIRPDIIHLHNLHSNYLHLNLLLKYLAEKDIATVITLHDCWYFTGKCFHYADVSCERFKQNCGNCPKKKDKPRSLLFDVSRKVLKDRKKYLSKIPRLHIVGCSNWVCGEAKKGILKGCDITCIYNGVDTTIFKPYEKNILKEKYGKDIFYVLGMANKWLLPSNQRLLESVLEVLNESFKLVLIGCKDEQIKTLQERSKNVIPLGFICDRKELAQYYSSADVFVNVTHVDTLPTVNMESICCGTPVITYDSCGSPELILEGCGVVIEAKNIGAMVGLLRGTFSKIEESSLLRARMQFDKEVCYQNYLDIYNKLMYRDR